MVLSGLAIWKPVQLHWLAMLMGDYEGARYVHFLAMAAIAFIVFVHVMMVVLVPRTLPTLITGRLKQESARASCTANLNCTVRRRSPISSAGCSSSAGCRWAPCRCSPAA